jgi:hypothetical protein
MSTRSYRSLVAGLITTTIIALPGYAQASPLVLNSAPGVGIGASAPMLGATVPAGNWTPAPVPFAGGPRETLAQCMGYWDAGTHMSKVEWRRACQRTVDGTMF